MALRAAGRSGSDRVTGCRWNPHRDGRPLPSKSAGSIPLLGDNMKIKSQKDFWSGLMFLGIGIAFAWGATNYTVGEGARMGPGYFPLMLGILLALIGLFVTFEALVVETEDGEKIGKAAWKPLVFIIASNLAF